MMTMKKKKEEDKGGETGRRRKKSPLSLYCLQIYKENRHRIVDL
jgi:hypothetical protein